MGKAKLPKTPEWKLKCFSWLPCDDWTVDNILAATAVQGKRYCKICDDWIAGKVQKIHIEHHVREQKVIEARVRAENAERARVARIERAEERRLLKAAQLLG